MTTIGNRQMTRIVGVDYVAPTPQTLGKMSAILHTLGEEQSATAQAAYVATKSSPERERFSVPHAARDPQVLQDRNLDNEDIFQLIENPPAGALKHGRSTMAPPETYPYER